MTFCFRSRGSLEKNGDSIYALLGALYNNGNILGEQQLMVALNKKIVTVFTQVPETAALDRCYFSRVVRKRLATLKSLGVVVIRHKILGHDTISGDPCSCNRSRSYILFTHYLTTQSPVRCGDCFRPVALYHLPPFSPADFRAVISWQSAYQAYDTLQMDCGSGEQYAIAEMSGHDSSLSVSGREICGEIERLTNIPTYYYLLRSDGHDVETERKRVCPACGGKWSLAQPWHGLFDFRCDRCRLLSQIAFFVSN